MTDAAPAFFVALEQSGFAAAIRQSPWLYPAANIGHIVSLTFFAGAIAVMDVRLLGGMAATAPGPLLARARLVAVAGLAGMAVTGFLLFSAEASHLALNPVFQLKAVLVVAGLSNSGIYELCASLTVAGLAPGVAMPARAEVAGLRSLVRCVTLAEGGRSIAPFWRPSGHRRARGHTALRSGRVAPGSGGGRRGSRARDRDRSAAAGRSHF